MDGYRRPELAIAEFRDAGGAVIPYGRRWPGLPPDDAYSATRHPERFAPLLEVARALEAALPRRNRPGGDGIPIALRETPFPGVVIEVDGIDFPFPACGCDACDEDVETLAGEMEELVDAAVAGRFESSPNGHRYWGAWGSRGGWTNPQGRA